MWIYSCHISPSKPATAPSPGSVCHTAVHKLLDLCSSWCSKCAVIAQSHMDWGAFIVSHQIYSSAAHVIMMLAFSPHHHLPLSPSGCYLRLLFLCPFGAHAWVRVPLFITGWLEETLLCYDLIGHRQRSLLYWPVLGGVTGADLEALSC